MAAVPPSAPAPGGSAGSVGGVPAFPRLVRLARRGRPLRFDSLLLKTGKRSQALTSRRYPSQKPTATGRERYAALAAGRQRVCTGTEKGDVQKSVATRSSAAATELCREIEPIKGRLWGDCSRLAILSCVRLSRQWRRCTRASPRHGIRTDIAHN